MVVMRAGLSLKLKIAPSRAPAASSTAASALRAMWVKSRSEVICGPRSESASTVSSKRRRLFLVSATQARRERRASSGYHASSRLRRQPLVVSLVQRSQQLAFSNLHLANEACCRTDEPILEQGQFRQRAKC